MRCYRTIYGILFILPVLLKITKSVKTDNKKLKVKYDVTKAKQFRNKYGNQTREGRSENIVIIPKEARFGLPKLYVTAGIAKKAQISGLGGGGGWGGGGGVGGGGGGGGWGGGGGGNGGGGQGGWGGGGGNRGGGGGGWGGGTGGGGQGGWGGGGGGNSGGGWGGGGNSGGGGWGGGNQGGGGQGWGGGGTGGGGGGWGGGGGLSSGGGGWGGSGGGGHGGGGGGWGGSGGGGGGWGPPQGWGGGGGGGWGWGPVCPNKKVQKAKAKAQKKIAKAKAKAQKKGGGGGGWGGWEEDEDGDGDDDGRSMGGRGWHRSAINPNKGDGDTIDDDQEVWPNSPPRSARVEVEPEIHSLDVSSAQEQNFEPFKYLINLNTGYGESNTQTERENEKKSDEEIKILMKDGKPKFPISSDIVPLPMGAEVEANPIFPETISLRLVCPKLWFAKGGKSPSMCMYVRA